MKRSKREWIEKMKSEKNIIWIDKPKNGPEALQTAEKLWRMYDDDYNLSLTEMCNILVASRSWVLDNIHKEIPYIFIGLPMRKFMMSMRAEDFLSEFTLIKDYYYYSRKDFYKWLKKNTVASRRTIRIDLCNYSIDADAVEKLYKKRDRALSRTKSTLEKAAIILKFDNEVYDYLTPEGQELYSNRVDVTDRENAWVSVDFELPSQFARLNDIKKDLNIRSSEMVYRELYKWGAMKYEICGSINRYDRYYLERESVPRRVPVTILYEAYKEYGEHED